MCVCQFAYFGRIITKQIVILNLMFHSRACHFWAWIQNNTKCLHFYFSTYCEIGRRLVKKPHKPKHISQLLAEKCWYVGGTPHDIERLECFQYIILLTLLPHSYSLSALIFYLLINIGDTVCANKVSIFCGLKKS